MSNQNPFAGVGTVVKGRRFIGRHEEILRLHEKLLGRDDFGSLAIIGMPRIGKSSLAHQALIHNRESELATVRGIVIYMDVSTITASDTFFDGIVRRIESSLTDHPLATAALAAQAQKALAKGDEDQKFFQIEKFFRALSKAGIRAICILDEFDSIRSVFHGKAHCFKFLRELASAGECKAGFVLLSKRSLSDISALSGIDPRYWRNVLAEDYLRGFDGRAVDAYFERLQEAGIQCAPELRSELLAQTGAHPFLLDSFAFEAFRLTHDGKPFQKKDCQPMLAPALLELGGLVKDAFQGTPWLGKLAQILVGPRIDVTVEEINTMTKYGLLVPDDKGRLWAFVPALTDLLRRDKTTTTVRINATSPASPCPPAVRGPFQLDCSQGKLKAANGMLTTQLPSRFLRVLQAMLKTESKRYGSIASSLSYTMVALLYGEGQSQDSPSNESRRQVARQRAKKEGTESLYVKKQAQQFKRDFRRWLNRRHVDIDDIVQCDRSGECYRLGNSWHDTPTIYGSEASILITAPSALENLAAPRTGKKKTRSPDNDDTDDSPPPK